MTAIDEKVLVEQLRDLRSTPLREGFEAELRDRLVQDSLEPRGRNIFGFRSPRRKIVFLLAAMTVPLAAAAATSAVQMWMRADRGSSEVTSQPKGRSPTPKPAVASRAKVRQTPQAAPEREPAEAQVHQDPIVAVAPSRDSTPQKQQRQGVRSATASLRSQAAQEPKGASPDATHAMSDSAAVSEAADGKRRALETGSVGGLERLGLKWSGKTPGAGSGSASPKGAEAPAASGLRQAGAGLGVSERSDSAAEQQARGESRGHRGQSGNRQQGRALGGERAARRGQ